MACPRPRGRRPKAQLTPALPVPGSHGDPGSVPAFLFHPSALCPAAAVQQKGMASEKPSAPNPLLGEGAAPPSTTCVWSHAAVPDSISSCSPVWTHGAGGRLGTRSLAHPPRLVLISLPYLTLNSLEALCGGGCVPYALWHFHATTQLRERSAWGREGGQH